MSSAWVNHVKKYAKEHNISYSDAMQKAKPSYKKKKKGGSAQPSVDDCYRDLGYEIGGILMGGAPKGALAALLSGLDARVNIK